MCKRFKLNPIVETNYQSFRQKKDTKLCLPNFSDTFFWGDYFYLSKYME